MKPPDLTELSSRLLLTRLRTPLLLFAGYTVAVAIVGLLLFTFADIGTQTTTTTTHDASGGVSGSTIERKDSTPVLVIFAAFAAGGWLLIPLRFAWDELAKSSDDRRAIAATMRGIVFDDISAHWGPMLYRERAVARWAERCLVQQDESVTSRARLLYAVATLHEGYDNLRQAGRLVVLKTRKSEQDSFRASIALQQRCDEIVESDSGGDAELIRAITTDAPEGRRVVSYVVFEQRLSGDVPDWEKLRMLSENFKSRCSRSALKDLRDCARSAAEALLVGINEVRGDWYSDARAKLPPLPPEASAERTVTEST